MARQVLRLRVCVRVQNVRRRRCACRVGPQALWCRPSSRTVRMLHVNLSAKRRLPRQPSLARAYIDSTGSNGKRRPFGLQLMKVLNTFARGASFCSQAPSGPYYSCIKLTSSERRAWGYRVADGELELANTRIRTARKACPLPIHGTRLGTFGIDSSVLVRKAARVAGR